MRRRRIFCECPDDLAALREFLLHDFGFEKATAPPQPDRNTSVTGASAAYFAKGDVFLHVAITGGKANLLPMAERALVNDSPSDPTGMWGICFDPDADSEDRWRRWLAPFSTRVPGVLVPLPWISPESTRYGLPDTQSLDRIAATALALTHGAFEPIVGRWIEVARRAGIAVSWKNALRLWNGIVMPDTSGAGFMSRIAYQEESLRLPVRGLLRQSLLWSGLGVLCDVRTG